MGRKGGKLLTLISLNIPAVPLRNPRARKIAAEHDHLGDEIVFDAVVEDLLKAPQCVCLVQPNVRKEKEVQFRKIALDPDGILSLCNKFFFFFEGGVALAGRGKEVTAASTYVLQRRRRSFTEKVYMPKYRAKSHIVVSYSKGRGRHHVSPRRFPAFAGRVPNRDHAECRILRVIALHERE